MRGPEGHEPTAQEGASALVRCDGKGPLLVMCPPGLVYPEPFVILGKSFCLSEPQFLHL